MAEVFDVHQQWLDTFGSLLVGGLAYYGEPNTDPTLEENRIDIFEDRALTIALPNPQTIGADGRVENKPWLNQRYSIEVFSVANVLSYSYPDNGGTAVTGGFALPLSNVQGFNIVTAQTDEGISSYEDQQEFTFPAAGTNTDSMTLNVDQIGATPIKFNLNEEMKAGYIQQNQMVSVIYNSATASFSWVNSGRGLSILSNVAGTADAITASGGPSVTEYINGQLYNFRAVAVNTDAVTLQIESGTILSVFKNNSQELIAGEIQINQDVIVSFNASSGGSFQIISQLSNQFTVFSKMCIPFFDVVANIPFGWVLCDGSNGTPNLVDRFIRGSNATGSNNGSTAGSSTTGETILDVTQMPTHSHLYNPGASGNNDSGASTGGRPGAATQTGDTGGGLGHTHPGNEPPYTNVLWIMKS